MYHRLKLGLIGLFLAFSSFVFAAESNELLQPDEAFQLHAKLKNTDTLLLSWQIADGYYLYQQKFHFVPLTQGLELGVPLFPTAKIKQDKNFGEVKVYYDHLEIELPLKSQTNAAALSVEITYQGCAAAGVCYLPVSKNLSVDLQSRRIGFSD